MLLNSEQLAITNLIIEWSITGTAAGLRTAGAAVGAQR